MKVSIGGSFLGILPVKKKRENVMCVILKAVDQVQVLHREVKLKKF